MANFEKGPTEGNGRRVLFVSGDDRSAKQLVSDLITSFGYAVMDLGDLDEGVVSSSQAGHSPARICYSQAEARRIGQRCK